MKYEKYDKHTAEAYSRLRENPIKKYVVKPTLFGVLGSLDELDVLDVGCGDGEFSRAMKLKGARNVKGIDFSESQIEIAKHRETTNPVGIEYYIDDARIIKQWGKYDIATAVFVLHYASTQEELSAMINNVSLNLKKGGRFIALNEILDGDFTQRPFYNIIRSLKGEPKEGCPAKITLFDDANSVSFVNYLWSKGVYETILKETGFNNVVWHPLKVSERGIEKYGKEFWKDFAVVRENFGLFEARKWTDI